MAAEAEDFVHLLATDTASSHEPQVFRMRWDQPLKRFARAYEVFYKNFRGLDADSEATLRMATPSHGDLDPDGTARTYGFADGDQILFSIVAPESAQQRDGEDIPAAQQEVADRRPASGDAVVGNSEVTPPPRRSRARAGGSGPGPRSLQKMMETSGSAQKVSHNRFSAVGSKAAPRFRLAKQIKQCRLAKQVPPVLSCKAKQAAAKSIKNKATEMLSKSTYKATTYASAALWKADTKVKYNANPKHGKSFHRYAKYEKARTIEESLNLGSKPEDLLNDYEKGHLNILGPLRKAPLNPLELKPADLSKLRDADRILIRYGCRHDPKAKKGGSDHIKNLETWELLVPLNTNMNLK